ncbi:MAG: bifunctional riboflavin kinase/FAD synthetase [Crocinitomicaceae bacterium]|nr:bifunctional riboflavin kinase/FAD synthetase [Flavobacteriales bacterium]NQZ38274.1 bifunctional riboflavin kinase/FAD synthetase [Crocinitomicaceae bacterium]
MKLYQGFDQLLDIPNPVLTIGTFDGVHIGHQKIIQQLNREAEAVGGESVLFTFYPHPRMVLYPESHGLRLIQTQAEKMDKLRRMGLQNIIVHPFTKEFSRLTAVEFVRDYLVNRLKVKKLVIGYDHQFGKNREGSIEFLKEVAPIYGFEVEEISAQEVNEVNISSTKIRNAILAGDMDLAKSYLGEPFELYGKVIRGNALGRSIGFPTANLDIESEIKLIPKLGVYAVNVVLADGTFKEGMMNIGVRPTIANHDDLSIEVNLFDFEGDLYDQYITVQLLSRFRDEMKFDSIPDLQEQLNHDKETIRAYFNSLV